jgi:hypothetical protein
MNVGKAIKETRLAWVWQVMNPQQQVGARGRGLGREIVGGQDHEITMVGHSMVLVSCTLDGGGQSS